MKPRVITITPTKPPVVSPDEAHVKQGQQIRWVCKDSKGHSFHVKFKKGASPFVRTEYESKSGNPLVSGSMKFKFPKGIKKGHIWYKYSVSVDHGKPLDPDVVVDQ
jgi:plastocyanin